jgi:uncharacterized membrane protein
LRGTVRSALTAIALVWLCSAPTPSPAGAADKVVRAVLFSSPTCPHCRKVREEVFPPLWYQYGGHFQVAVISTATPEGRDLYWAAHRHFGVQQRGVPLLVVGDFALVGSDEIPRRLPGLVLSYLGVGGTDWPPLPGLDAVLAATMPPPASTPPPTPVAPPVAPEPAVADAVSSEAAQPSSPSLPTPEPTPATTQAAAPETEAAPPATAPPAAVLHEADTAAPKPAPVDVPSRSEPAPSPSSAAPASQDEAPSRTAAAEPAAPAGAAPMLIAGGADEEPRGVLARVLTDPRGNGLAILVLLGMVAAVWRSVVLIGRPPCGARRSGPLPAARRGQPGPCTRPLDWLTPVLGLAGLSVAAYLAHVEVREIEAVCGPVGDCNTVQQSEYARLFGVLPIGVLGLLGFAAILAAWGVRRWGPRPLSSWAAIALLAMTGFGTLFSIYLTFLEPFVIGATCMWCLSSAVIMTTLHGLAHAPGRAAVAELRLLPASG